MQAFIETAGRGLLGIVAFIAIAFLFSRDRRNVNWRFVVLGIGFVFLLGIAFIKIPGIKYIITILSNFFVKLVDFSDAGAIFLFGDLAKDMNRFGYIFAFHILPNIILFSAIASLLYYFRVLPKIVELFARLLSKVLHLSGPECTAAAANVFLGQTNAPIMVKPYLPRMSRSEIFTVMTTGMATVAGGVILGVIAILGGEDEGLRFQFANYLLLSSILSAPCALIVARIILPKSGPVDEHVGISCEDVGMNAFDSIVQGTEEGLKIALAVGSVLLVFTALITMVNWGLIDGIGSWTGLNEWMGTVSEGKFKVFSLEAILAFVFAPVAWILGIQAGDLLTIGQLLGQKLVFNEFVAYSDLSTYIKSGILSNPRSIMIASFALCNFANLASIGVQITGLSALASNQRHNVAQLALLAVVAGNLACFISACIATIIL